MTHILVITNDSNVLDVASRAFNKYYKLTSVDTNSDVIKLLSGCGREVDKDSSESHTPDKERVELPSLILLDSDTNDQYGIDLIKRIKGLDSGKDIPIILITAGSDEAFIRRALINGAVDVTIKPLIPVLLTNRVSIQLELVDYHKDSSEIEKYQDAISVSFAELVECRDITTGGHIKNSTHYFKLLLDEILRLDRYKNQIQLDEIKDVIRAVPLHDIGKIGINDEILNKASPLDYNEFEYMKTHTVLGKETFEKIIRETGGTRLLYIAKDLAFCHHEKWDGTGYPMGLKGEEIPLYARIMTIADVYDALTSQRTYKVAFPHKKAMSIMKDGKGTLFDPDLLDIFEVISNRFEKTLYMKNHHIEET